MGDSDVEGEALVTDDAPRVQPAYPQGQNLAASGRAGDFKPDDASRGFPDADERDVTGKRVESPDKKRGRRR